MQENPSNLTKRGTPRKNSKAQRVFTWLIETLKKESPQKYNTLCELCQTEMPEVGFDTIRITIWRAKKSSSIKVEKRGWYSYIGVIENSEETTVQHPEVNHIT